LRYAQTPRIGNSRHPVGHPVIFGLGVFAAQKPQEIETAGIHADRADKVPGLTNKTVAPSKPTMLL
jgi:hypothetical protein